MLVEQIVLKLHKLGNVRLSVKLSEKLLFAMFDTTYDRHVWIGNKYFYLLIKIEDPCFTIRVNYRNNLMQSLHEIFTFLGWQRQPS